MDPLRVADGAVLIDTTDLTARQVAERILGIVGAEPEGMHS